MKDVRGKKRGGWPSRLGRCFDVGGVKRGARIDVGGEKQGAQFDVSAKKRGVAIHLIWAYKVCPN